MASSGFNDSSEDTAWVSLLARSVAILARRLPETPPFHDTTIRSSEYLYGSDAAEDDEAYRLWVAINEDARTAQRGRNREQLRRGCEIPKISVVIAATPGFDPRLLSRTVASAFDQDVDGVEVRLGALHVNLSSESAAMLEAVEVFTGVAAVVNAGAATAVDGYIAFLEVGDELEPGVLADVALALGNDSTIDLLYTDSDFVDAEGGRHRPFFKPGWSPDLLLSQMYIGSGLLVVRASLLHEIGGFQQELDGAHWYDFVLRATERAGRIVRLPIIGYHRRLPDDPPDETSMIQVLEAALQRRRESAVVERGLCPGTYRVRRRVRGEPIVTVIVPFHNGAEHLRRCVRSIQEKAGYERWEAILVDNRSWEPGTRAMLARFEADSRIKVLTYPGPFNWAAINNYAAEHSNGSHLLFMNADVEGRSDGWIAAMLEHSQRPEVGAVGARLLYPSGQVQHAGVVMGLGGGVAWHLFCYCPEAASGYFDQAKVIRNYSAVTGACMMVRNDAFSIVGGFREDLPIAYNDVDFCLRLQQRDLRVVYTPFAELVHDESFSRGRLPPDRHAVESLTELWRESIENDPYYNPNLDLYRSEAALAWPKGGSR